MSDELQAALRDLRAKLAEPRKFVDLKAHERVWNQRAGGWSTEARCPRCGARVVYNGNYFCEYWNHGDCRWALPHPALSAEDRKVCDVVGVDYH